VHGARDMSRLLIREYLAEIDPLRAASGSGISEAC
jgi:hypothetical protein